MSWLFQEWSFHTISLIIMGTVALLCGQMLHVWRSDNNRTGKIFLVLIQLTTALLALSFVVQLEAPQWEQTFFTFISLQMVFGPLLYLYTRYQTHPNFRWTPSMLWHAAPLIFFAGLWLWQLPLDKHSIWYMPCFNLDCPEIRGHRFWHKVAAWVSIISYALVSLKLLAPHENNMKSIYSELEDVSLGWLKAVSWCLLLLTLTGVYAEIIRELGYAHTIRGAHLQAIGPLVSIFLFARYGTYQRPVYSAPADTPEEEPVQIDSPTPVKKYQTSSLTSADAAALWQRIQQHMLTEHPFLEPGLKVSDLAKPLKVSVNHVSETINGYANMSFYDYVNGLRVDEAKRLLADDGIDHLSVTDIGYHAGFNSTSTFYTHFKKLTGLTPKQYQADRTVNKEN